jgi:hypothetical protein
VVVKSNSKLSEEIAVLKNEISHVASDVSDVKEMLKQHVEWEADKYDKLDEKYVHRSEFEHLNNKINNNNNKWWDVIKIILPYALMGLVLLAIKFGGK